MTFKYTLWISILIFTLTFIEPPLVIAQVQEGIQLFETGQSEQAKEFFEDYLKSNKNNAEANFWLGRVYFDQSEWGEAANYFEKAAGYDEGNSHYHMWLGHSYGRGAQNASILRQAGLARKSRNNYENAVELDPSNIEARESLLDFYMQAPRIMGGGRDKAEAQAVAISELDPVTGAAAWGNLYTYYDEHNKALVVYEKAITENPEAMSLYYALFSFYFNNQDFDKAAEVARKQLTVNDTTASVYLNLGNALQRNGDFETAFKMYLSGIKLDPDLSNFWYQIGRLAGESGTYLKVGKEYITRYLKTDLDDYTKSWAYYRLGTIHEHLLENELAKTAYKNAINAYDHELAEEALNRLN